MVECDNIYEVLNEWVIGRPKQERVGVAAVCRKAFSTYLSREEEEEACVLRYRLGPTSHAKTRLLT